MSEDARVRMLQRPLRRALGSLENWKGQPARARYVNDERFMMVEISCVAIQEVIDLLKDVEGGIVRNEP